MNDHAGVACSRLLGVNLSTPGGEHPASRGEVKIRVGIAADHGGFVLKGEVTKSLRGSVYEIVDFGAHQLNPGDGYPDFIIPMARAVAAEDIQRGVALCGSCVGASIAANKVPGV